MSATRIEQTVLGRYRVYAQIGHKYHVISLLTTESITPYTLPGTTSNNFLQPRQKSTTAVMELVVDTAQDQDTKISNPLPHANTFPLCEGPTNQRHASLNQFLHNQLFFYDLTVSEVLLSHGVQAYWEHAHPVFPLLPQPCLRDGVASPELLLVIMLIGLSISGIECFPENFKNKMHLVRALYGEILGGIDTAATIPEGLYAAFLLLRVYATYFGTVETHNWMNRHTPVILRVLQDQGSLLFHPLDHRPEHQSSIKNTKLWAQRVITAVNFLEHCDYRVFGYLPQTFSLSTHDIWSQLFSVIGSQEWGDAWDDLPHTEYNLLFRGEVAQASWHSFGVCLPPDFERSRNVPRAAADVNEAFVSSIVGSAPTPFVWGSQDFMDNHRFWAWWSAQFLRQTLLEDQLRFLRLHLGWDFVLYRACLDLCCYLWYRRNSHTLPDGTCESFLQHLSLRHLEDFWGGFNAANIKSLLRRVAAVLPRMEKARISLAFLERIVLTSE